MTDEEVLAELLEDERPDWDSAQIYPRGQVRDILRRLAAARREAREAVAAERAVEREACAMLVEAIARSLEDAPAVALALCLTASRIRGRG